MAQEQQALNRDDYPCFAAKWSLANFAIVVEFVVIAAVVVVVVVPNVDPEVVGLPTACLALAGCLVDQPQRLAVHAHVATFAFAVDCRRVVNSVATVAGHHHHHHHQDAFCEAVSALASKRLFAFQCELGDPFPSPKSNSTRFCSKTYALAHEEAEAVLLALVAVPAHIWATIVDLVFVTIVDLAFVTIVDLVFVTIVDHIFAKVDDLRFLLAFRLH